MRPKFEGASYKLEAVSNAKRFREAKSSNGSIRLVWRGNFSSADTIAPGEVLVREVRLQISKHFFDPSVPVTSADLNPRGPFYWGFPVPEIDDLRRVTMRAVFANDDPKSDTGMEKKTVWTGRIASPYNEYKVSWDVD